MHAQEIEDKYALPEVDLGNHRVVLININSAEHNGVDELYDRVRYAWRINRKRAERAEYVLPVIHGIVRGVFVPQKWLPATRGNFPSERFGETSDKRSGFVGISADEKTWIKFAGPRGKRLPESIRHGQNPVRYHNC